MSRVKGMLGCGRDVYRLVVALAWRVYQAMLADPKTYPAPDPALAVLLAAILATEAAHKAIGKSKDPALTAARSEKLEALARLLEKQLQYVQGLADAAKTTEAKTSLVLGAGYEVEGTRARHPKLLVLSRIAPPGTILCVVSRILLVGKTSQKVTFNWQYSLDSGVTWVDCKSTPLVKRDIENLPLMKPVLVRVSATVGEVEGPWSTPETIVVH